MRQFITTMGEILIDFLPIEEQEATVGFRMHPGGSPFNTAVGVARLGQPAAFVTRLASDFFGRYLHTYLQSQNISTRFLVRDTQALTTLAFVAMEDGEPVYTFYDQGAADTLLTSEDIAAACFAETRMLHFGSISLLRGTTPHAVQSTVERLRGHALLSFDPNLRPTLVRDETTYRQQIGYLASLSDIVKISAADLAWLEPTGSAEQAAAALLRQGAAVVVVTLGGAGVLAMRLAPGAATLQYWQIPAFVVDVVDTIGAGDTFSAGLLVALAEQGIDSRDSLLHASYGAFAHTLRFAAAVSAITCTRAGANPPYRGEVEHFLRTQPHTDKTYL